MNATEPLEPPRPTPSAPERPAPLAAAADAAAVPLARRLASEGSALGAGFRAFERMWSSRRGERMPMVGWFDPLQLLRTGAATLVSTLVGRRSDARVTMALAAVEREYYDCSCAAAAEVETAPAASRDELWIDYVCDTGDGWNPTYAVAYAAAQPSLALRAPDGAVHATRRADVLVFGGDQVYPSASRLEYERRLVAPYEQAFGADFPAELPQLYAIPGNHDWYDGLSAFMRLFCTDVGGRRIAGWRTRQRRSYFALRLPGRWWLLGSDSQLTADLDTPQIEYFREIAERHMQPGDRAILCLSQPTWVYAHKYRRHGGEYDETDLLYLREEVFAPRGIDLKVFLAGDLHHYRRHEEVDAADGSPIQKITAGGGGAFLHPTHDEDVARIAEEQSMAKGAPREYALRSSYPTLRQSWRLAWGNLLFAAKNPTFGIVPAIIYSMTAWLVAATVDYPVASTPLEALRLTANAFLENPGLALWIAFVATIFVVATDTHSRVYKVLGGLGHAGAHWFTLFWIGWGAAFVANLWVPSPPLLNFLAGGTLVFVGGWVLGSIVMGLYLLVSLNVFGRHSEEAFSSLKIEDFKHFLRLRVRADGELTVFPVRIERVPRRWRDRAGTDASPSLVQPVDPLVPELIEPPIVIPPAGR